MSPWGTGALWRIFSILSFSLCQCMLKAHPCPRFSEWSGPRWISYATASACRWVLLGMARQQGQGQGSSAKPSNAHASPMQIPAQTSLSFTTTGFSDFGLGHQEVLGKWGEEEQHCKASWLWRPCAVVEEKPWAVPCTLRNFLSTIHFKEKTKKTLMQFKTYKLTIFSVTLSKDIPTMHYSGLWLDLLTRTLLSQEIYCVESGLLWIFMVDYTYTLHNVFKEPF